MTAARATRGIREECARGAARGWDGSRILRPRVLVVVSTYLPGVKGGGHIRSISALATHLGDELDPFVICGDRDSGDESAYPNIRVGEWTLVGNAQVMYLSRSGFSTKLYQTVLAELRPDVLYLNTVFSVREIIVPAMVARRRYPSVRIIVAPRGCLNPGALALKRKKKLVFLRALRWSRLPKSLIWQASSETEALSIRDAIGKVDTVVASNLPMVTGSVMVQASPKNRPSKASGKLEIIFLSRISPMKNLEYLLKRLANVRGEIDLTIAGPVEDVSYWAQCEKLFARRLSHVSVRQIGSVAHDDVASVLASHHIFVLPTRGENFGHVILEAFDAGLGVVVSDRTPWRGLEQLGAGWDLPLENPLAWEHVLQTCCDMDGRALETMSAAAKSATAALFDVDAAKHANLALFYPAGTSPNAL